MMCIITYFELLLFDQVSTKQFVTSLSVQFNCVVMIVSTKILGVRLFIAYKVEREALQGDETDVSCLQLISGPK